MFSTKKRKKRKNMDEVIIEGQIYSVRELHKKAKRASRKLWASIIASIAGIGAVFPYLANAGVVKTESKAFTGTVIPGYDQCGLNLTAYGIDINEEWGNVKNGKTQFTQSTYGIWSGSRASDANSQKVDDNNKKELENNSNKVGNETKAKLWADITGKSGYTNSTQSGTNNNKNSVTNDIVSPYRTQADYQYWDAQAPNNSQENLVKVSLMPDFVVLSIDGNNKVHVCTNPDDVLSQGEGQSIADKGASTAIPYYVALSDLMNLYNLKDSKAGLNTLMEKIKENPSALTADFVKNNNLLNGTNYKSINNESSQAFNPYPYSMVFTKVDAQTNQTVGSSIYSNTDAYVFFSPKSVYNTYKNLDAEYNDLAAANNEGINNNDLSVAVTLGYYQAAMAICEAYLMEALPQDMTRGYIGPKEDTQITGGDTNIAGNTEMKMNIKGSTSEPESFQNVSYSTTMYDVSNYLTKQNESGNAYALGYTNSIMDTLSVFGYTNTDNDLVANGPMKGMKRDANYSRHNAFTAYTMDSKKVQDINDTEKDTGLYMPTYYPIQQHMIDANERQYRFSIISTVPYETVKHYLQQNGFGTGQTKLSYDSQRFDAEKTDYGSLPDEKLIERMNKMINMFQTNGNEENASDYELKADTYDASKSPLFGADVSESTEEYNKSVQGRVDSSLIAYSSNALTADNVHDFIDVIRSVTGLKKETWYRYYNPIKSTGNTTDIFLTRVSPSQSYLPSILLNSYSCAGGNTINEATRTDIAAYDYFSIPSTAPCLATHTRNDCYYGSLNYELRGFLQLGFLKTINRAANVPAVEAAYKTSEAAKEYSTKEILNSETMKQNLKTLFAGAQYETILSLVRDNKEYTINSNEVIEYLQNNTSNAIKQAEEAYNANYTNPDFGQHNGRTQISHSGRGSKNFYVGGETNNKNTNPNLEEDIKASFTQNSNIYPNKEIKFNFNAKEDQDWWNGMFNHTYYCFHSPPTGDPVSLYNYAADVDDGLFKESPGGTSTQRDIYFCKLYRESLLSKIEQGGDVSWFSSFEQARKHIDVWNIFDTTAQTATTSKGLTTLLSIFMPGGTIINAFTSPSDTLVGTMDKSEFRDKMKEATDEMQQAMKNFYQGLNSLQSAMPSQMQNAIAWADRQSATDSEDNYQSDPNEANVIVYSGSSSQQNSGEFDGVVNINDANKYNATLSNSDSLVPSSNVSVSSDMQAKTVRGVDGATATYTGSPASYTSTAIVSRIQEMEKDESNYPYSGLAESALLSGTDKYMQMQSHYIDYTNIANGLENDLANWQDAKPVTLVTEHASPGIAESLGNFLEIINNIGYALVKAACNVVRPLIPNRNISTNNQISTAKAASTFGLPVASSYAASASTHNNNSPIKKASTMSFDINTKELSSGGVSLAKAADNTNTGQLADIIIIDNELMSNVYQLVQVLALIIVMLILITVAMKNLLSYTSGDGNKFVEAQTTLKVLFPRAIVSVLLIGLPPIGTGTGFRGLGFMVLQGISSIMDVFTGLLTQLNGVGFLDYVETVFYNAVEGFDLGMNLIVFFFGAIEALALLILGIFIIIITIGSIIFFLACPLASALFLWPYSNLRIPSVGPWKRTPGIINKIIRRGGDEIFGSLIISFVSWQAFIMMIVIMLWAMTCLLSLILGQSISASGVATASAAPTVDNTIIQGLGENKIIPVVVIVIATLLTLLACYLWAKKSIENLTSKLMNSAVGQAAGGFKDKLMNKFFGNNSSSNTDGDDIDNNINADGIIQNGQNNAVVQIGQHAFNEQTNALIQAPSGENDNVIKPDELEKASKEIVKKGAQELTAKTPDEPLEPDAIEGPEEEDNSELNPVSADAIDATEVPSSAPALDGSSDTPVVNNNAISNMAAEHINAQVEADNNNMYGTIELGGIAEPIQAENVTISDSNNVDALPNGSNPELPGAEGALLLEDGKNPPVTDNKEPLQLPENTNNINDAPSLPAAAEITSVDTDEDGIVIPSRLNNAQNSPDSIMQQITEDYMNNHSNDGLDTLNKKKALPENTSDTTNDEPQTMGAIIPVSEINANVKQGLDHVNNKMNNDNNEPEIIEPNAITLASPQNIAQTNKAQAIENAQPPIIEGNNNQQIPYLGQQANVYVGNGNAAFQQGLMNQVGNNTTSNNTNTDTSLLHNDLQEVVNHLKDMQNQDKKPSTVLSNQSSIAQSPTVTINQITNNAMPSTDNTDSQTMSALNSLKTELKSELHSISESQINIAEKQSNIMSTMNDSANILMDSIEEHTVLTESSTTLEQHWAEERDKGAFGSSDNN